MSTSALFDLLLLPREFVERNDIPVTDQTEFAAGIVHEQFRNRYLPAGNQNPVWRKLRVNVRLARTLRTEFDQVVVPFAVGNQACELVKLVSSPKHLGNEAHTLDQ